jgi:hypothetical protein
MSDCDEIVSLSSLRAIESLELGGSQLDFRWKGKDKQLYKLGIPLFEACKLVGFLQDALCAEGRDRRRRANRLIGSVSTSELSTTLPPVEEFKGIFLSDFVHLQWEVVSGACYELKMPFQMAMPFLDALEETLPLDRRPSENIAVHFEKAIPLTNFTVLWRAAYRADRYLKEVTLDSLNQRAADISANTMRMDDDRKLRPILFIDNNGLYKPDRDIDWLRLLTDVHTELRIRGQLDRMPSAPIETHFPRRLEDESWCRRPDLIDKSLELRGKYVRPKMLFKFGERKWNEKILETGKIRLTPASKYNRCSLNPAVRDDELKFSYFEGNSLREYQVDDYYLFCVSGIYDCRFYGDFGDYDTCLVIRDAEEFCERIRKATELNLRAKVLGVRNAPVIYFDPFRIGKPERAHEIWFAKHFRYAYQHEFRFVWPPRGGLPSAPFELDIGDVSDLTELITRDSG